MHVANLVILASVFVDLSCRKTYRQRDGAYAVVQPRSTLWAWIRLTYGSRNYVIMRAHTFLRMIAHLPH